MTPEELVKYADELRLTAKQRAFCFAYASGETAGNGVGSARAAGYAGNSQSLGVSAGKLLKVTKVREFLCRLTESAVAVVEERTGEKVMSLAEALETVTNVARLRIGDLIKEDGELDIQKIRNLPAGVLKKFKTRNASIEAESALAAASRLVDHYTKAGSPEQPNVTHNQVLAIFGQMPTDQLLKLREALAKKEDG